MALKKTCFQFFSKVYLKSTCSQSFQFMTLNAFKQMECNEKRKVVRFSLAPPPSSSTLRIY